MKGIPEKFYELFAKIKEIKKEMAKAIVGQEEAINHILICLFSGGHALLESAPGLAKSLMAETLSKVLRADYKRIQLTPDLTPQDITGYEMPVFGTQLWVTRKGPIFTTLCVADEFNRASEKTQAGFMEPMQEKKVSIGLEDLPLDKLFTLIATRNPIETGGTFAIAEAIIDRFMINVILDYPSLAEERKIAAGTEDLSKINLRIVCGPENILPVRDWLVSGKFLEEDYPLLDYTSRIVQATRPSPGQAGKILSAEDFKYYKSKVRLSLASPRATKALIRASVIYSFGILGQDLILPEHIKYLAKSILRHRLILQDEALFDGNLAPDDIIDWLLERIPIYV